MTVEDGVIFGKIVWQSLKDLANKCYPNNSYLSNQANLVYLNSSYDQFIFVKK